MENMDRRGFLKKSLTLGAASALGYRVLTDAADLTRGRAFAAGGPDLSVVSGGKPFEMTRKAVASQGGMERVVSRGDRVGLLINSPFGNPGTHVAPDVALAVVTLCYDAGAADIISLKGEPGGYWDGARRIGEFREMVGAIKEAGPYVDRPVTGGLALKKTEVVKDLLSCDVFLNISIVKHHQGTNFSCLLKNMMGALPHSACRYFHMGTGKSGWYGDLDHMHQCIADVNLIRKPDMTVVDATSFITTNGPFGPGKLADAAKVLAGTDPVLADAYGATLMGHDPRKIGMIQRAAALGIGSADLKHAAIAELAA